MAFAPVPLFNPGGAAMFEEIFMSSSMNDVNIV
jgi:hypothetical protein